MYKLITSSILGITIVTASITLACNHDYISWRWGCLAKAAYNANVFIPKGNECMYSTKYLNYNNIYKPPYNPHGIECPNNSQIITK